MLVTILTLFSAAVSAGNPPLTLTHLCGNVYAAQDDSYLEENSAVYMGNKFVTGIGATWTP